MAAKNSSNMTKFFELPPLFSVAVHTKIKDHCQYVFFRKTRTVSKNKTMNETLKFNFWKRTELFPNLWRSGVPSQHEFATDKKHFNGIHEIVNFRIGKYDLGNAEN